MVNPSKDVMSDTTSGSWNHATDVLSLRSFPSTSILKYGGKGTHLCKCTSEQRHRDLFAVNLQFTCKNLLGEADSPNIRVCHNAENIWECVLPRALTGLDRRVPFENLPNVGTALKVLKKGTYWYPQLLKKKKFKNSAFQRKFARLLAGLPTPEGHENFHQVKLMRIKSGAVQRLRSMLATVDGVLMQVVIAFPGSAEFQNWKRIDQIQRSLISQILDDYFKDIDPERVLTFEKVKRLRKEVKLRGFNPTTSMKDVYVPRELSALRVALSLIRGKTPLSHLQVMIMSQTRASGVPPRAVYDRTLAKTKAILTTPSDKNLYKEISGPLARATDHLYSDLLSRFTAEKRDNLFEKVVESAKISLSDSGEFFTKSDLGGKLEASRRVLHTEKVIPEIDLHTGKKTGKLLSSNNSSQGEMLFHWACGKFTNRSEIYSNNSMSCRISLVAELGKYRTITVSSLQHALLLHPMSHMGLTLLEAFPSSESGIGAANHAWNFFKRLSHKNPSASFIFNEKNVETSVMSTDWESATDYCDPYIAGAMLNRFLYLIGVPPWYRETVLLALTAPRQVETLDRNGAPIEVFYTKRGVLMGDPVTKVVLHLHHLIGRKIAGLLLQDVFKDNVLDDEDSESEDD